MKYNTKLENIPELSLKVQKFKIHNKEVYMITEDNNLLDDFFTDLNQFKSFEESKKKLTDRYRIKMNIPDAYDDKWVLNRLIDPIDILDKIEELHTAYMRDKINSIFK